jgi:hypothetical protein
MKDWLENQDLKFITQLNNFAGALPAYAATFGLNPTQVTAIQNDAAFAVFVITRIEQADNYKQNWVKLKDQVRYGMGGDVLAPFPAPISVIDAPPAVQPNVEKRFRELVKTIKANANYTKGIGEALGIEKPESEVNPSDGKPEFTIHTDSGHPVVKWKKSIYDGVDVYVDRGTGFTRAERDLRPPYVDRHPLPAVGTSAVWKYKLIYVYKDETIGSWSDEVAVTVVGEV